MSFNKNIPLPYISCICKGMRKVRLSYDDGQGFCWGCGSRYYYLRPIVPNSFAVNQAHIA